MTEAVRYTVEMPDLSGHLFRISLAAGTIPPEGLTLRLPAWIPGSYMIREFARNIVRLRAYSASGNVSAKKSDKHTWHIAPAAGPVTVEYEVYAWDLSVRSAHIDRTHAFFNGSSLFLEVLNAPDAPYIIDIVKPGEPEAENWRIATALSEDGAERYGFGTYRAENYDELIDSPVEIGDFILGHFEAFGVPHDIAITGRIPNIDIGRIEEDLKRICETEIAFFEPETKKSPVSRYVFLVTAVGSGYGGLEHRASTALLCSRASLPSVAASGSAETAGQMTEQYQQFLGLCSHEYFHTWNVKRIKPAVYVRYDLTREAYTSLLWLFEGITSYYDDLILCRSGLIGVNAYLRLLANTMSNALRGKGQTKQSIAESSFDAWIKYYRQDENAPNAISSYYTKGAITALALDLTIRLNTEHQKSLDDFMLLLWQRFGKHFYDGRAIGITDEDALSLAEEAAGFELKEFFAKYIYGTEPLPLSDLLNEFGVSVRNTADVSRPGLDIRTRRSGSDCIVSQVFEGGAAHRAGISAGDVLLAIDGLRVSADASDAAEKLLSRYRKGDTVSVHVFRRDELMELTAVLDTEYSKLKYALHLDSRETEDSKDARRSWLKKTS